LKKYRLSDDEWDLIGQLQPILDIFLEGTLRMSRKKVPLLHEVIPIMDICTAALDDAYDNVDLHPAVRVGAKRGREILNKYYSKTDDSIMYRGAMLLHPRYKKTYFIRHGWPAEWVETAVEVITTHWERFYKPDPAAIPDTTSVSHNCVT
ncbi:hypothetical protein BV25DRAFT_1810894, partial [Artomyces pyxidatus]